MCGHVTYAGEVTYGNISVCWSHCPSHTVVQEKCHFLHMRSFTESACLERLTFYTFVSVTTCRTLRFIQSLRCNENACLI